MASPSTRATGPAGGRWSLYFFSLIALAVSCVVFPNSLKLTAAAALTTCFATGLAQPRTYLAFDKVMHAWALIAVVSLIYAAIGQYNGAPGEAAAQVVLIYGLFPLLWIVVVRQLLDRVDLDTIVRWLVSLGIVCCLTVVAFYYLFFTFGPDSVMFFIEEPNIDTTTEGYIGATMYVFGSLIFIIGGYVAAFDVGRARTADYLVLALFVVIALIAGRSALVLTLVLAAFLNVALGVPQWPTARVAAALKALLLAAVMLIALQLSLAAFDLDLFALVGPMIEKLSSAGGEGRMQQFDALRQGAAHHAWLGAGHGIGVAYTVSDLHPWRYEMVWLASVFRVGIAGAVVYAAPFVAVLVIGIARALQGRLSRPERFLLSAFASAFIASNTNPYVEALVFQWMYALPIVYFLGRPRNRPRPFTPDARTAAIPRWTGTAGARPQPFA